MEKELTTPTTHKEDGIVDLDAALRNYNNHQTRQNGAQMNSLSEEPSMIEQTRDLSEDSFISAISFVRRRIKCILLSILIFFSMIIVYLSTLDLLT